MDLTSNNHAAEKPRQGPPFWPWWRIEGGKAKPQFFLKDAEGREFGVVEHYPVSRPAPHAMGLEFISASFGERPFVWVDLSSWSVVIGKGRNLPDADFEPGLQAYLNRLSDSEKSLRLERLRRSMFREIITLAEQGYTIAFQEIFPEESRREDLPELVIAGQSYRVDDQYGIRPGEFREEVTLVFIPEKERASPDPRPAFLVNWKFSEGVELLDCELPEDEVLAGLRLLLKNPELEKIYRQRLQKMRREGVLLGVKSEGQVA